MTNKASSIPFIILGFVTIFGCGRFTERVTNDIPKTADERSSDTFTLTGKEWSIVELDQMDIEVDLPGQPRDETPQASRLPAGYDEVFSSMRVHSYDEQDFGSSYTQLVPTGKTKFEIEELAEASMASVKNQTGNLTYTLDVKSPTKAKFNGTFTRDGKNFELRGCCIYKKTSPARVWEVVITYPKENSYGRTAGQRIIDSVVFKGSSEECR